METTLHRQLKALYSDDDSQREVQVDGFRIDAVREDVLIEIQCASLSAIRDKIRRLLRRHRVLVVKPLAANKRLVKRNRRRGRIVSRRYSPSHATFHDLFLELVHFVRVFPHPRLSVEVLLTDQEEHRLPPLRGRRWRARYRVEDRRLIEIRERLTFRTATDLLRLLPASVPNPFTTADIARESDIPRWLAQKMAYCLRETGAAESVGKRGNAILYRMERRPVPNAA